MKDFVIYTALRFLLFIATAAIVLGVWRLVAGELSELAFLGGVAVAFLISGLVALRLLEPQRARLAKRVEDRAAAAATKFDEMRSKED